MNPIKVRLISPPFTRAPAIVPPLGMLSIGSYARQHLGEQVDVRVYDCSGYKLHDFTLLDEILEEEVHVVGLPVYSEYVEDTAIWARYIKKIRPEIVLVAGGPHVTLTFDHFVKRWGHLYEYCITGEGEKPFMEMLKYLLEPVRTTPDIKGVGRTDANGTVFSLPSPGQLAPKEWTNPFDVEVRMVSKERPTFYDKSISRQRKAVTLVVSRSCPMRCSFCAIIAMPGVWVSAESLTIISWLKSEYEKESFEHIYFLDANFFVRPRIVKEIAQLIRDELPGTTWSALSTVLMFLKMRKDMGFLRECGLRMVEMGIESGCQRQLDIMKKDVKVAKSYEAVELLREHGFEAGLDYIMFYPEQTIDDLRENLIFLRNSGLIHLEDFGHYFNTLTLYPKVPLRAKYAQLFDRTWDPDEVPSPDDLFTDPAIQHIHKLYCYDFRRAYMPIVERLLSDIIRVQAELRTLSPKESQRLRLETISLKLVPFKVLWQLTKKPEATTLHEAAPWLDQVEHFSDQFYNTYTSLKKQPA